MMKRFQDHRTSLNKKTYKIKLMQTLKKINLELIL